VRLPRKIAKNLANIVGFDIVCSCLVAAFHWLNVGWLKMKPWTRALLVILLLAGVASAAMTFIGPTGRWLTSAGLLFDIAGIVQLELSGLFEDILERFSDEKKYPYGPPSHITRRIIKDDNPDTPIRSWIQRKVFLEKRTGFQLIFVGFIFQYLGDWF